MVAGALHLSGVLYYLIFASGKRQPWADDELILTVNERGGLIEEDVGYDTGDETESLLTRSLKVERLDDYSDEYDEPSWYMNTI